MSCAGAGDCTAVGDVFDADGNDHPFYATEADGSWGTATEVGGVAGGYGVFYGVSVSDHEIAQ